MRRTTETMKWSMVAIACDYGASDMTYKKRLELFKAVIKVQSYLYGFVAPAISVSYFLALWRKFKTGMRKNPTKLFDTYLSKAGTGRSTWVDKIMAKYPQLLHKLYRYATRILTCSANTKSIIACMKCRSKVLFPDCPTRSSLSLTKYHFWEWFHRCGGILKRSTTKNRLTPQQRRDRIIWSLRMKLQLSRGDPFYVCFLNEKWFYSTSRRKKIKILPKADFENEEEVFVSMPKVRSRRHAVKVMYMAIVARPIPKEGFDGKIFIKEFLNSFHHSVPLIINTFLTSMK